MASASSASETEDLDRTIFGSKEDKAEALRAPVRRRSGKATGKARRVASRHSDDSGSETEGLEEPGPDPSQQDDDEVMDVVEDAEPEDDGLVVLGGSNGATPSSIRKRPREDEDEDMEASPTNGTKAGAGDPVEDDQKFAKRRYKKLKR